jgi:transaldolase/glucose-6-phosphate isomerase
MPPKTIDAFRDHGVVAPTLTSDIAGERRVLSEADRLGLDLAGVSSSLVEDGIGKFSDAADALLKALAETRERLAVRSRDTHAAAED